MFKRVLVPLDGSLLAESALEPALHLAEQHGGAICLIRVPVYMDSDAQSNPDYERIWTADNAIPEYEDTATYLSEMRNRFARRGVSVKTIVGEGELVSAIIETAVAWNADLIMMGSHVRRGISRWLLGSVSSKVIGRAPVPVMLVRRAQQYSHILVTLDGSEIAEHILEPALALAAGFGSQLTILQIDDEGAVTPREVDKEPTGGSYLDQILERYEDRDVHLAATVGKGPVAKTIMSFADSNNIDLIAMFTHGHSGFHKLIYGSVTDKVMSECGNAMLIVGPTDNDHA